MTVGTGGVSLGMTCQCQPCSRVASTIQLQSQISTRHIHHSHHHHHTPPHTTLNGRHRSLTGAISVSRWCSTRSCSPPIGTWWEDYLRTVRFRRPHIPLETMYNLRLTLLTHTMSYRPKTPHQKLEEAVISVFNNAKVAGTYNGLTEDELLKRPEDDPFLLHANTQFEEVIKTTEEMKDEDEEGKMTFIEMQEMKTAMWNELG